MDCPVDQALDALTTDVPALERRHGIGVRPPPPGPGKDWFGTPAGETLVTDNFGLVWSAGQADVTRAQAVADALEDAWQVLIEDEGWAQPTLSETYLVWVVLDPYLGTDGETVEAPEGYAILSVDPNLTGDDLALASAHQLMHAIQYRMRDPDPITNTEAWYWEASAVWASAKVVGGAAWTDDADGFLLATGERYDSKLEGHDRGMFLLNTWIEEDLVGSDGMLAVWEEGQFRPQALWPAILESATGTPQVSLFAEFHAQVANGNVGQPGQIDPVQLEGNLLSGVSGTLPLYGAHAYRNQQGESWIAETTNEGVVLAVPGESGSVVRVEPNETLVVMGTTELVSSYQVFLRPADDDGYGDPQGPTGRTDPSTEALVQGSCGCASGGSAGGWALIPLFAAWRRRR